MKTWLRFTAAVAASFAVYAVPVEIRAEQYLLGPLTLELSQALVEKDHQLLAATLAAGAFSTQAALALAIFLAAAGSWLVRFICFLFPVSLYFVIQQLSFALTLADVVAYGVGSSKAMRSYSETPATLCSLEKGALLETFTNYPSAGESFFVVAEESNNLSLLRVSAEGCEIEKRLLEGSSIEGPISRSRLGHLLLRRSGAQVLVDPSGEIATIPNLGTSAVLSDLGRHIAWAGSGESDDNFFGQGSSQNIQLLNLESGEVQSISLRKAAKEFRIERFDVMAVNDSGRTVTLLGIPSVLVQVNFEGETVWGPTKIEPPRRSGKWIANARLAAVRSNSWVAVFTEADTEQSVVGWLMPEASYSVSLPAGVHPIGFDFDASQSLIAVSVVPEPALSEEAYPSVLFIRTDQPKIAARYHLRTPASSVQFLGKSKVAINDSLPDMTRTVVLDIGKL